MSEFLSSLGIEEVDIEERFVLDELEHGLT